MINADFTTSLDNAKLSE